MPMSDTIQSSSSSWTSAIATASRKYAYRPSGTDGAYAAPVVNVPTLLE